MTPEPLDPKKYHVLTTKRKLALLLGGFIIILGVLPIAGFLYYKLAISRPSQNIQEKVFTINAGESVSEISRNLYTEDLVNSEFLFKFYIVFNKLENNLQAGVYTIPAGTSVDELAYILLHGTNDATITFLEGWRVEEFAEEAAIVFDKTDYVDFVELAKEHEGYLFPDTYSFSKDVTERELINHLTDTFNLKTKELLSEENLAKAQLTKEEVMIIASIVEREVNLDEDKRLVAGILIKRYKDGTLLGADATTQYAVAAGRYGCAPDATTVCPNAEEIPNVNWWPHDLTQNELESKSAYNTRAIPGLPPAPISNPGLSTIEATLEFEESEFYYYINDTSGKTHFAKTLEEHNENIQTYLR